MEKIVVVVIYDNLVKSEFFFFILIVIYNLFNKGKKLRLKRGFVFK